MMNLIEKKGILLHALIGLLVSATSSQAADNPEAEVAALKVKLILLENRYRHLCQQFSNLPSNCSSPVFRCNAECPDGWLHVGDQCFHLSTDRDDFSNSTDKCSEVGAHLATLTTKEEHDAVEQEARRIGGIYTFYWIGLTDVENEGHWKWADNSTLETPFWNVEKSEPDNNVSGGPEGEDCVVVDSYNEVWYDVPCSFSYPRICQKDSTLLHPTEPKPEHSDGTH